MSHPTEHIDVERRSFPLRELRVEPGAGGHRKIVGYAAVFDVLSEPLAGFREKIRKGAFAKTIREADVRALFNHDENYVLGRLRAKTLKLWEDDTGLGIEILPPDTQWARDLAVSMQRGDVDQMSFAFRVIREDWSHTPELEIRTLVEVELRDVSPVTFPAYTDTVAQVRSVFGVPLPRLNWALRQLEAGALTAGDRALLRRVFTGVEGRRFPALGLMRRRLELLEAGVGPPLASRPASTRRLRRELDLLARVC